MKGDLILASIVFIVLNALDLLTTFIGLSIGLREANPVGAAVHNLHGEAGMLIGKVLVVAIVLGVAWLLDARYQGRLRKAVWLGCTVMALVVGMNAGQLYAIGAI